MSFERWAAESIVSRTEWTDVDFNQMSWHDNHVHGLQIEGGEHGVGTFSLDLDYILEWLSQADKSIHFRIAPAILKFKDVFRLKIDLDWAGVQAGMTPFSISGIGREQRESHPGYVIWSWMIDVNWPEGLITFDSSGFTQYLRGQLVTTKVQYLEPKERG